MALFGDKKKEKKEKSAKERKMHYARQAKLAAGIAHEIVRAPWFSEKSLIITDKGVYTFEVSPRATKAEIAAGT